MAAFSFELARLARLGIPAVDTLKELGGLAFYEGVPPRVVIVAGFHVKIGRGGGVFRWDPSRPKNTHDGGTIIDPVKLDQLGAGWPGTWFTPALSGIGCWVRDSERMTFDDFGAYGDGVTDDTEAMRAALQSGVTNSRTVFIPAGVYINVGDPLAPTFQSGKSLHIVGEGVGVSIIKDRPGARQTRFASMIRFQAIGVVIESIRASNFTIDKSGSGTIPPSPGSYEYEQAHCFLISSSSSGRIKNAIFENIQTKDLMGGGIVFSSGEIVSAVVSNCHGTERLYTGGKRGDLEFQASIAQLLVTGCSGHFVQSEPNVAVPFGGVQPVASFVGCQYTFFDLIGYAGAQEDQIYTLTGCTNGPDGDFWIRSGVIYANQCRLRSGGSTDWRNATGKLSDCVIIIKVDVSTNTFIGLPLGITDVTKQTIVFSNCGFIADNTANGSTLGSAIAGSSGALVEAVLPNYMITFIDCDFSPVFERTLRGYRNGGWEFRRCKLVSRAGSNAINIGSSTGFGSSLLLEDCDLSRINGDLIYMQSPSNTGTFRLEFRGTMDFDKFSILNRPPSEWRDRCFNNAVWTTKTVPEGGSGIQGQLVRVTNSSLGAGKDYVCSVDSVTASVWRMAQQSGVPRNTTANRPILTSAEVGAMYVDTSLGGKPIWWTGTVWVDSTGATV